MVQVRLPKELSPEFYALIPEHRAYIDKQIEEGTITLYAINSDRTHGWVVVAADTAELALAVVEQFPIYSYLEIEIDELFIFDGETMRLPKVSLN